MSNPCSAEKQHPNDAVSLYYGPSGLFASPTRRPLADNELGHVLSFLNPEELARAERVCRSWNQCIHTTDQWKKQCENRLNIPTHMDPRDFLSELEGSRSYKGVAQLAIPAKVLDARIYQRILGAEIEPVPPKETALEKRNEQDSCDPAETIGQKYVWIDSPSYFKISVDGDFPFELDKPDDPNDDEAPRLIQKEVGLVERFRRTIGLGSKPEEMVLKVPNTINNLGVLFKHPKKGNPSTYDYVWEAISAQHGNKRIPAGRICMREDVIGRNLTFAQQQATATAAGVAIPQLGHRILFNFLRHAEAEANTYPDGRNPWTFARTSTLTVDSQGVAWPSGCGGGGPSGLGVGSIFIDYDYVGVAVALPAEVQAIGT